MYQLIDCMKSVADAVARLSEALCIACFCKDRNSVESNLPASILYGGRCTANATQQCKQIKANMYRVLALGVAASEAAGAVPRAQQLSEQSSSSPVSMIVASSH